MVFFKCDDVKIGEQIKLGNKLYSAHITHTFADDDGNYGSVVWITARGIVDADRQCRKEIGDIDCINELIEE